MSQHLDFLTSKYRYSLDMVNAIWVSIFACLVGRLFDFRGHSMSDFDFNLFLVQKKWFWFLHFDTAAIFRFEFVSFMIKSFGETGFEFITF